MHYSHTSAATSATIGPVTCQQVGSRSLETGSVESLCKACAGLEALVADLDLKLASVMKPEPMQAGAVCTLRSSDPRAPIRYELDRLAGVADRIRGILDRIDL